MGTPALRLPDSLRAVDHFAGWRTQLRQYRLIHGGTVVSYEDVAAVLHVDVCSSCEFPQSQHRTGVAHGNTIHWAPRRLTRRGLRQFLMLVAETRILNFKRLNAAMRVYARNAWAVNAARRFHVRIPRAYSRADRYLIRWLISQGATVSEAARRWAYRKET